MIEFLRDPASKTGKQSGQKAGEDFEIEGPLFELHAWHQYQADVGPHLANRSWELWGEVMGAYMVLDRANLTHDGWARPGRYSDDVVDHLAETADRLARQFPIGMSIRYFQTFVLPSHMKEGDPPPPPPVTWWTVTKYGVGYFVMRLLGKVKKKTP